MYINPKKTTTHEYTDAYAHIKMRADMPIKIILTWGRDAQWMQENEREPSGGELSSDSACTN